MAPNAPVAADSKDKKPPSKSRKQKTTPWERKDRPELHEKRKTKVTDDSDGIGSGSIEPH